ncbi:MAG TPA: hypothetical protein VGY55_08440 [Pirellulales bacterium]|jgi:hypothetical protein|nr:hypothetical protein [Pirellulales bacterium]
MLEEELEFFAKNRAEWLAKHSDRVALVKGRQLIGMFDNEQQAIEAGARQFGLTSFLVKRITADEPQFIAPALTLGLLRADHPSRGVSSDHWA